MWWCCCYDRDIVSNDLKSARDFNFLFKTKTLRSYKRLGEEGSLHDECEVPDDSVYPEHESGGGTDKAKRPHAQADD